MIEIELNSKSRRRVLIKQMNALEDKGKTCKECDGECCTFSSNSMKVSPVEAMDVIAYFEKSGWEQFPKEKIEETIRRYRLDRQMMAGIAELRRTYTCPFFGECSLGCSLPIEVKPYGCLGFNYYGDGAQKENCYSDETLLKNQETATCEEDSELNQTIKKNYDLFWDKESLPQALLELYLKVRDC